MSRVLEEVFRVRSYESDPSGHASTLSLCNYLQEAASNSAFQLGFSKEQLDGKTWVLSRLVVEVNRYPAWREDVTVRTWPSGAEGLFGTREFVMEDAAGQRLGAATSDWLLIDVERRRPVRIPDSIIALGITGMEKPVPGAQKRLEVPQRSELERSFTARYSDLDPNGHVNNVRFIEWALEGLPGIHREQNRISRLEIHFKTEMVLGESVKVVSDLPTDGAMPASRHRLENATDGRDVAHMAVQWRKA
jgi:medium-chain acyl-[acyl-carrier-protein] hydrolase